MIDSDPNSHVVLIKTAPPTRLENEIEALKLCRGHKSVRQLVDVIDNPQSLVLEYLDKTLYEASCEQKLDRWDVKRAVKSALLGLAILHAHKRAHTDIKPNNILVNKDTGNARFGTIQLGDLGDSVSEDTNTNNGEHIISAPIYRAPEVMLNARWSVAVDIWSLGATTICYLLRRHLFVPHVLEPGDEFFALAVLILQNKYFGPFPEKFFQLLDDEGAAVLRYVLGQCGEETQLFAKTDPGTINSEDKEFILYLMKPDPRDRPSATEVLMHPWLNGVEW
ncbi:MAG: hypothetical protein Q9197_005725 [Variospora fuerteventurae]